jgi:hypothetical protein
MADTENPWQSPDTEVVAEAGSSRDTLTATMIEHLKGASPWLRFIGVLGYIGAAFLILMGVAFIVVEAGNLYLLEAVFGNLVDTFVGVLYMAMGVVAFFPARFTYKFGIKIRDYLLGGGAGDLETAFRYNQALWKFSGVLTIVWLSLAILGIVGGVLFALVVAFQF